MTHTARRLKPFSWSWTLLKLIGWPIVAGCAAMAFIGFTNPTALGTTPNPEAHRSEHVYCNELHLPGPSAEIDQLSEQLLADPEQAASCALYPLPTGAVR